VVLKRNKLPIFIFFLLGVFCASCESIEVKGEILFRVFIDNPTDQPYIVFINGQKNKIKPNTNEVFELEKGEYHFKVEDKNRKELFEENIKVDTTVLLNVSDHNYYMVSEIYSDNKEIYKKIKLDTLFIMGETIIGLIEKLPKKKKHYKQKWEYHLDDTMPHNLPFNGDYSLYTKIVRERDLIDYCLN
jgi:hypothetical protein